MVSFVLACTDPPRRSIPTGIGDFGLVTRPAEVCRPAVEMSAWCDRLGPVFPAFIALNRLNWQPLASRLFSLSLWAVCDQLSGPPFTSAEGGTKVIWSSERPD